MSPAGTRHPTNSPARRAVWSSISTSHVAPLVVAGRRGGGLLPVNTVHEWAQVRCARLAGMPARARGRFIDPMLLLRTDTLPSDSERWEYQLKFDGYRAVAFKTGGRLYLRSRN